MCLVYHWTLDYVLDRLTISQVAYFHEQAVLFLNPDKDPTPDKEKFDKVYGKHKKISR